jgi:hypothetical protein
VEHLALSAPAVAGAGMVLHVETADLLGNVRRLAWPVSGAP